MKTKKRFFKALLVILLVGFGLFLNLNFEITQANKKFIESENTIALESNYENNWSESLVYNIKVLSISINHLILTL